MRTERVAAVDQGDGRGDRLEVQRPVERAVTTADDDDVLADVRLEARDEELETAAQPAFAGGQRTRAELPDARGDQDGPGADRGAVVEPDGDALVVLDQYVEKVQDGQPRAGYDRYRALVTVVRTDRGWLVSNIETK